MARDYAAGRPISALLATLVHGDQLARIEAARLLIHRDDETTVPPLIRLLETAEDPAAREWPAYVLGFMGDARAEPALIGALRDPGDALDVRCNAAEALGHLLGPGESDQAAVSRRWTPPEDGPQMCAVPSCKSARRLP